MTDDIGNLFNGGVKEYDYVLETLTQQGKISCMEVGKKNDWLYQLLEQSIEKVDEA